MISSRLKNILLLSIPLYIIHAVEEYSTGLLREDHFFQWASNITKVSANTVYVVEQILLLVVLVWAIYKPKPWLLVGVGLLYIYELVHITRAISVMGYYPGLITALFFPVIGYFYWAELLKIRKNKSFSV